jgi:hypothetical protein
MLTYEINLLPAKHWCISTSLYGITYWKTVIFTATLITADLKQTKKKKLRCLSLQANYTDRLPHVGKVSANFFR